MTPDQVRPMERQFLRAGSFVASIFRGQPGQHHAFSTPVPVERKAMAHRSLVVTGRMRLVHAPEGVQLPADDWVAGVPTTERPALPAAGSYVLECVEPTLYICLQRGSVDKRFNSKYLLGHVGQIVLPFGSAMVMGAGRVTGPLGLNASGVQVFYRRNSGPLTLTAEEPVWGICGTLPRDLETTEERP